MKKIKGSTLMYYVIVFMACLILPIESVRSEEVTPAKDAQSIMYGLLVTTQGRDFSNHRSSTQLIQDAREAGFHFIVPKVRENGTVYYISRTEIRSPKISSDYIDPLSDLLTLAHFPSPPTEPIIEVYPWLDVLKVHDGKVDPFPAENSIAVKRGEWLSLTYAGEKTDESRQSYLDPALPGVKVYLEGMVKELTSRYTIKGIYFDCLCYPGSSWGYNPESVKLFQAETGFEGNPSPNNESWLEWRRSRLTELVRGITEAAHATDPEIKIIIAVNVEGDPPVSVDEFKTTPVCTESLQDWPRWVEEGIVDIVCVKNHWRDYADADKFNGWLKFVTSLDWKPQRWFSIAGKMNFTDDIIGQIRSAQAMSPDAIILDNYRNPTRDDRDLIMSMLKQTVFEPREPLYPTFVPPEPEETPVVTPVETLVVTPVVEEEPTTPTLEALPVETEVFEEPTSPTVEPVPFETEVFEEPTTPTLEPDVPEVVPEPTPIEEVEVAPPTPIAEPSPVLTPVIPTSTPVKWDTIYLTNGNVIQGKVTTRVRQQVIIETSEGMKLNLTESDIERIVPTD